MKAKLTLNIPKEIIDLSIMHLLDIFNGDATNINKSKIEEWRAPKLAQFFKDLKQHFGIKELNKEGNIER